MRLFVDLETKGDGDILKSLGASVYSQTATITDCAWAIDGGEVKIGTLEELAPLVAECDEFIAHNSFFDLTMLSKHGVRPKRDCLLGCTAAMCSLLNLPAALKNVAPIVLGEEKLTMPEGLFVAITEDMDEYIKQDVKLCQALFFRLQNLVPESEYEVINAHLRTNLRGFKVDVMAMIAMSGKLDKDGRDAAAEITDIFPNANSNVKLKEWFISRGHDVPSTGADDLASFDFGEDENAVRLAELLGTARSPDLTKIKKLAQCITKGDRFCGAYQYAGALTGRWSSSGVQMHNLKKTKDGPRSLFIAGDKCKLWVSDFAQIELRVNLWLSGEKRALNKLATEDLYQQLADKIGCNRHTAKQVLLAAQYGVGKYTTASRLRISEDEAADILRGIHDEIPGFRKFFNELQRAVTQAYRCQGKNFPVSGGRIKVSSDKTPRGMVMSLELPTGRAVVLHDFRLDLDGGFIMKARTGEKGDGLRESRGIGKLIENVCSAIARDYLAEALVRLNKSPLCQPVGHLHDELIVEVREEDCTEEFRKKLDRLMLPEDNSDLPLAVESKFVDNWQQNND